MSNTNFPVSLDDTTKLPPIDANDTEDAAGKEHDVQHTTLNEAVIAVETKVGINQSADPNSLDYRVGALEFAGMNEQTGTAYTLVLADAKKGVRCTNAAAITLTIPANATVAFPLYCKIPIFQGGVGAVNIVGTGFTPSAPYGNSTVKQDDFRIIFQRAIDTWVIM